MTTMDLDTKLAERRAAREAHADTLPKPQSFSPDASDMLGTYLGITGTQVGEDGDWMLLGHHEPRRAAVAVYRIGRQALGYNREECFGDATVAEVVEMMEHGWAVFERHPEGCLCKPADPLDGEDYRWCPVNDHGSWYCRWGQVDAETPGAVPVTHLPGF